ncbi:Sau3AI family type II restriction endonuclease [Holzapfeliella sp. JNUCC72]
MNYLSVEQVHQKAQQIRDIKQKDLIQQLGYQVKGDKNLMGDLFESWFGKPKDSDSSPDLGIVELKATPFKRLKSGKISAKERLVLNIINYENLVTESFDSSHLIQKNENLELAFYEYNQEIPKSDWFFKEVFSYQMKQYPADFEIIKKDWHIIQEYVKAGKAHELSESLTDYLSACTKGANRKSVRTQPFSDVKAKQRAFSFKSSFMTNLLRQYVFNENKNESIIKNAEEVKDKSLEQLIKEKFEPYIGKTQDELQKLFQIDSSSKNTRNMIVRAILGLNKNGKLDKVDEFEKASIVPKSILVDEKNNPNEHMSFPEFSFQELVNQNWTDKEDNPEADLHKYLVESKFLFVVFKEINANAVILKGIKFYSVPQHQLDTTIKEAWLNTKHKLKEGVQLELKGQRVYNNLIKSTNKSIVHVRPHSRLSSYQNNQYANKLPTPSNWVKKPKDNQKYTDNYMTTQSFWFNKDYIKQIISDLL